MDKNVQCVDNLYKDILNLESIQKKDKWYHQYLLMNFQLLILQEKRENNWN